MEMSGSIPLEVGEAIAHLFVGKWYLRLQKLEPQHEVETHSHNRDHFSYVLEGRGWFHNGDVRQPYSSGSSLLIKAGIKHKFEALEHTEVLCSWKNEEGIDDEYDMLKSLVK